MEEEMQFLQTLYQKSPKGILILNADGLVIWANNTVQKFMNHNVLGISGPEFLRQNNDKEIAWPPDTAAITRRYVQGELIEISSHTFANNYYLIDINRLEGENGIKTEMEKKLSETLANVQHDLKSPLNTIIGFTDMAIDNLTALDEMQEELLMEDVKSYLKIALNSAWSMVNIINRFLVVEKLEQDLIQIKKSEIDMISFTKSLINKFNNNGLKIQRNFIGTTNISVNADVELLEIALENMLLNAKEAIESDQKLKKEICFNFGIRDDRFAFFQVINPGLITPENLKKIFKSQFTTKATGNGIGTKSIRLIAKAHAGYVTAECQDGNVIITLLIPQK
ncbi:HAMP domain-containing histidine kinase [Patescibacteria group bacterium]|nr:HAMP domain-containing histidine kinase [Patescibacteria group bacterium]